METYVHGYTDRETIRLNDQANALDELLHYDSVWPDGSFILEVGCGVGAQTKIIAANNPKSHFISADISSDFVAEAKKLIEQLNIQNVTFKQADIFELPFRDDCFDHVFVCFLLEHVPTPAQALAELRRVLKPGGTITAIEGDHGSAYFYPDSAEARDAIQCQVTLQKRSGGDANIGRRLYPLLNEGGFCQISVSPRVVYVDDSKPGLAEGFTKNTFTAMIEGIANTAISEKLITAERMKKGISDLYKTAGGGGTFCYAFFKGTGIKSG